MNHQRFLKFTFWAVRSKRPASDAQILGCHWWRSDKKAIEGTSCTSFIVDSVLKVSLNSLNRTENARRPCGAHEWRYNQLKQPSFLKIKGKRDIVLRKQSGELQLISETRCSYNVLRIRWCLGPAVMGTTYKWSQLAEEPVAQSKVCLSGIRSVAVIACSRASA